MSIALCSIRMAANENIEKSINGYAKNASDIEAVSPQNIGYTSVKN